MMQAILACPKPVIAAVEAATAAGCQLVATCDLAVAGAEAPVLPRPASTSACSARRRWWRCRAMCPRKHAMEMLLIGEPSAPGGAPDSTLSTGSRRPGRPWRRLSTWPPDRDQVTPHRRYRQGGVLPATGAADPRRRLRAHPAEVMVRNMLARDAEEGIGAFIDKRTPKWEGR